MIETILKNFQSTVKMSGGTTRIVKLDCYLHTLDLIAAEESIPMKYRRAMIFQLLSGARVGEAQLSLKNIDKYSSDTSLFIKVSKKRNKKLVLREVVVPKRFLKFLKENTLMCGELVVRSYNDWLLKHFGVSSHSFRHSFIGLLLSRKTIHEAAGILKYAQVNTISNYITGGNTTDLWGEE